MPYYRSLIPQKLIAGFILTSGVLLTQAGCATISAESVALSQMITDRVNTTHAAYMGLLDEYFILRRQQIDAAIQNTYLPLYMKNIREGAEAAGETLDFSDPELINGILIDINSKRDEMQLELDRVRATLMSQISTDHTLLLQASGSLTGLLASAVEVNEVRKSVANAAARTIKPDFDFDRLGQILDGHLQQAGDTAGEVISIHEQIKVLLDLFSQGDDE